MPGRAAINHGMDDLMIELKGKVASKLQDARKVPFAQISGLKKVWWQLTLAYLHISFQGETIKGILLPAATITAHYTLPHTAERNEDLCVRSLQSGKYQRNKINAILTDSGSNMIQTIRNWLQAIHEEEEEEAPLGFQFSLKLSICVSFSMPKCTWWRSVQYAHVGMRANHHF